MAYDAAVDIATCLQQKELEIRDRCGYVPDDATFEEDEGSEGKSGAIRARIWMTNDAYFDIYEAIEIVDESHAHRRVYSYALIVDFVHEYGWNRDPIHPEDPVHEHDGDDRERVPAGRITLSEAWEGAWERLTSRELAPWTDDS
ncbi:MAG TPA: hypothetical protein VNM41_05945 [Solirubrobacterales bacterium]|nr:hypothetical protein [Solirubrobacterales bacterium]